MYTVFLKRRGGVMELIFKSSSAQPIDPPQRLTVRLDESGRRYYTALAGEYLLVIDFKNRTPKPQPGEFWKVEADEFFNGVLLCKPLHPATN